MQDLQNGGIFSSQRINPTRAEVCFKAQDDNEDLRILVRSTRYILLWHITRFFGYSMLFWLVYILLISQNIITIPVILFVFFPLLYLLFSFGFLLQYFTKWYYNLYLITNKRIIDYDYSIFSGYRISETTLDNIEDITESRTGFLPSMLNYGDVLIQTAGANTEFYIEDVDNPAYIRDKVLDLAEILKKQL